MEVKISVIMGVYQPRSRQILFQAVLSICSQTFSDWELIMVDDGTHGEGRDWIDQASLLDARIRLIRLPRHKGLSTALNAAIAASRGSYIARMDADDLSAPHRLQRLYDFLQAHAQYAWAGCCCRLVDEDGAWGHVRVPREPCARDFLSHSPYIHPSVMFRAHALADGYCEARSIGRSEDYELFMRLHAAGLQGANVQEYLYLYREDRNSYHRRSFPHALREARTRGKGFAAFGLPSLSALPYIVKPLFVAMTPPRLHWRIKQRRYADDIMRFRRVMARMPLMAVRTDSMKRLDQYAYAVFGPVLCGFVIWVLKEAQHRGIRTGTLHAVQHTAVDKSAFIFAHRDLPPLKQDADAPIRHQIKGYRAAAMISRCPPARRDGLRADLQFCARLLHADPTFHNIGSIEARQASFVVFSTKNTTTLDGIWSMTFTNFQKQKNIIFFCDNFVCSVRKD